MATRQPKMISTSAIIGQRGVALIETLVLKMGFLWHPAGTLEGGIDGHIELRDPATGKLLGSWIAVQSKATERPLPADSADSFKWYCDARDLEYWLKGNLPVVLIVSRPSTAEAYWVSIKHYFSTPQRLKARLVEFDKARDRFDDSAVNQLISLGMRKTAGVYLSPPPRSETLYSNLLTVADFADTIWVADTQHRLPKAIWGELSKLGGDIGGEWILKEKKIMSFRDLTEFPWNHLCDRGTAESFSSTEWSLSSDRQVQNDFVRLLKQVLAAKLRPEVRYSPLKDRYFFRATPDLNPRVIRYTSLVQATGRVVFRAYTRKHDPTDVSYYRHSAFEGDFVRYDDSWYLQITPTYFFTWDGQRVDRYHSERLSKMYRIERNQAVLGQVRMWAEYLNRPPDLFTPAYPFLQFGSLLTLPLAWGIDDRGWLERDYQEPGFTGDQGEEAADGI